MSQTFDPNAILIIHPSHPSMRQATIPAQVSGLDARARSFDPFMSDLPCASSQ